jgi:serine/threonine protein kinase
MRTFSFILFLLIASEPSVSNAAKLPACLARLIDRCLTALCKEAPYEELGQLGKGSHGSVTLVKKKSDGKTYAHKSANFAYFSTDITKDSVRNESYVLSKVNPDNNSPYFPASNGMVKNNDGKEALEMEYIDGTQLQKSWEIKKDLTGTLFYSEAKTDLNLIKDIALGLGEMHKKGFLHLDLTDANVMRKENDHAVIFDFGLSVEKKKNKTTYDLPLVANADFSSPELLEALKNRQSNAASLVGPPSDLYSLGVILQELLDHKYATENFRVKGKLSAEQILAIETKKRLIDNIRKELVDPLLRESPIARPNGKEILFRINQLIEAIEAEEKISN